MVEMVEMATDNLVHFLVGLFGVLFASSEMICKAVGNLPKRAELCVKEYGNNFQNLLKCPCQTNAKLLQ